MNQQYLAAMVVLFTLTLMSSQATALTVNQFIGVCESVDAECSEHPFLQAYVGGALDLIATLEEETNYLAEVYCNPKEELFNVSAIIRYMETNKTEYEDKNAMLLVIRYFEERGGC